jgi:hypothetical protein
MNPFLQMELILIGILLLLIQCLLSVTNIACRTSGARIMLQGDELYYEIAIDLLVDFIEKENQVFEFLEKYSENVYRKTILKILV